MSQLPEAFLRRIQAQFGEESEAFIRSLDAAPSTSIRLNPVKGGELFKDEEQVPWCAEGKYLQDRPSFTLDPLLHAGCYYPQESSSMIIGWIMTQLFGANRAITCLDLCAAPGGKSLLLSDFIGDEGRLISNEIVKSRNAILREVITKWGRGNTIVTNNQAADFGVLRAYFDCVLVDAPCSGEGMFRKDLKAREEWSGHHVIQCAERQKDILSEVMPAVKRGGYLIYSTCTFASDENESACRSIMDTGEFEPVFLTPDETWNLKVMEKSDGGGLQFLPHRVKGEGFFVAVFRRIEGTSGGRLKERSVFRSATAREQSASAAYYNGEGHQIIAPDEKVYASPFTMNELNVLAGSLFMTMPGLELGEIIRNELVPAHALALSSMLYPEVASLSVNREDAISYLRGEQISAGEMHGWVIVRYLSYPLGWLKAIGTRSNNYYPKEWRIRMK